ncbi:hypothetical protein [Sphingomonas sp.]|nr:hypothetical protein [Sphingomonas sp.]
MDRLQNTDPRAWAPPKLQRLVANQAESGKGKKNGDASKTKS